MPLDDVAVVEAAEGVAVSGEVRAVRRDPPVSQAVVRLAASSGAWRDSTFTDAQGRFTFSALAPGDYSLEVRMIGYTRHRQALTLAADRHTRLRVVLRAARALHEDCPAPDGRSMGQQHCR